MVASNEVHASQHHAAVKNVYIFVNPTSGGYSSSCFDQTLRTLKAHGYDPTVFNVRTPADILAHCVAINQAVDPLVIVAAGDGTFNAVVNGLQPGTATLAVLPYGTSNVLAAELGIRTVKEGVARICAGESQSLSIGLLELNHLSRRFVLMAGIGLDGAVVRDVLPLAKKHVKQGAYAISAIGRACAWDRAMFEIVTPHRTEQCHSAIICNGSRYGGNFILAPGRTIFSPGFEVICIKDHRRRTYLKLAVDLFCGNAAVSREITRLTAESLEIKGEGPIQIDGDFVGYGPGRLVKIENFAKMIV